MATIIILVAVAMIGFFCGAIYERFRRNSHTHDWGKWEKTGKMTRVKDDSIVGFIQERTCNTCGYTQSHKTDQIK